MLADRPVRRVLAFAILAALFALLIVFVASVPRVASEPPGAGPERPRPG